MIKQKANAIHLGKSPMEKKNGSKRVLFRVIHICSRFTLFLLTLLKRYYLLVYTNGGVYTMPA